MIQLVHQENAVVSCCLPVKSMLWVSCSNGIFALDTSLNAEVSGPVLYAQETGVDRLEYFSSLHRYYSICPIKQLPCFSLL